MMPLDPNVDSRLKDLADKAANDTPQGGLTATSTPADSQAQPGPQNPLVTLPWTETDIKDWRERIKLSDERIQQQSREWDLLLKEYRSEVIASGQPEALKVNKHFRNVHTKTGQLFYQDPEIRLQADDSGPIDDKYPNPMAAYMAAQGIQAPPLTMETILACKQQILNKKLGRDGIKVSRLFDELLFDVLAWAGIGCSKIGYRAVTKTVQQPVMVPDPNYQPPPPNGPLGLTPPSPPPMVPAMDPMTGQPQTRPVPVTIYEECYWRRFSPKKFITDATLNSGRYDEDATFMGMHFYMTKFAALKAYPMLTEDKLGTGTTDDKRYQHANDTNSGGNGLIHFQELVVKLSHYTDEVHPQAQGQLVLMDGMDEPVVWRPWPDQEFDQQGQLTADSIDRFPYRVLTTRDVADSCFPQSDAAFQQPGIKEMTTYRRQTIMLRDSAIARLAYDKGAFDGDDLNVILKGEVGKPIGVEAGRMREAGGLDNLIRPISQVKATADDYRMQDILSHDLDEMLGLGSVQVGSPESTVRSATEIAAVQSAVAGRAEKERSRVIDHYLEGVRLLDILIMRYTSGESWVRYVGMDGVKKMQIWNKKMISGKFLYDISPDSKAKVDSAQDRQEALNLYNVVAPDPLVNRRPVLKRLFRAFGYDADEMVLSPQQVMQAQMMSGMPPNPNPPHPGGPVNKHEQGKSGGMPNAPGAPNHRQTASATPPQQVPQPGGNPPHAAMPPQIPH